MDSFAIALITFICTLIATYIAWKTFKSKEIDDPKTEQQMLIEKFELLDKLNSKLTSAISQYSIDNNCANQILIQGLTYSQSLEILGKVRLEILCPENYRMIKEDKIAGPRVKSLTEHFDTQIKSHSEVETQLRFFSPMSQTYSKLLTD